MRTIVLLLLFVATWQHSSGQVKEEQFDVNRYHLDTLRYQGEVIIVQRYDLAYLKQFRAINNESAAEVSKLHQLEGALDQIKGYILNNQEAYWNIKRARESIMFFNREYPAIDTTRFGVELTAYQKIDDARFEAKEALRRQAQQRKEEIERKREAEARRIADSAEAVRSAERERENAIQAQADLAEHKAHEKACIKKYGALNGKAIANNKILLGMNRKMCIEAWGEPDMTNKSTTKGGITEKLIYSFKRYVVLKNDKVVTINE